MAHGGRAERTNFSNGEWDEIDKASYRLARAFGYGPSWSSPTLQVAGFDEDIDRNAGLKVGYRGRVTEQSARSIDGSCRVKRQHAWTIADGIVNVSYAAPDPMGQAALSLAALSEPQLAILQAFALEDGNAWLVVERALHRALRLPNKYWAGRDAMARIMFRLAAVSIDDRAKQIRCNAAKYRRATREAELILRGWLLAAAEKYNGVADAKSAVLGRSQGRGQRSETWWHPERPFIEKPAARVFDSGRITYLKAA